MSAKPSVLVTRRWPAAVEAKLQARYKVTLNKADKPLAAEDLRYALKTCDAVLPTVTDNLNAEILDLQASKARILANYGVGYSHIDESSARQLGIVVSNTPDVLSECTADLAMTLLLMATRRAGEGERELREGAWHGWRPTHLVGAKASGKCLGIVGFGRIGQAMARRAHHGFGMSILVHNRSKVDDAVLAQYAAHQVDTLDDLLSQCDYLSLHCPGGNANRHLINADCLERMKPTAFLVNTARGEVVDEHALAAALNCDRLAGAALDVYDGEPRINARLLEAKNTVLLPHLGSATRETREAMGLRVLDNLDDFFAGREPRDRVI